MLGGSWPRNIDACFVSLVLFFKETHELKGQKNPKNIKK